MTVGSLFSGVGGFDLGFERAGCDVRWQIEIDGHCGTVLARHWPQAKRFTDINALVYGRAKNRRHQGLTLEPVDILCGGFPCQDVSVAGKRKGLAGARSGLFFAFMRAVRLVKPRWVVIENVPGLLTSHRGRDFHAVLVALAECGMRRSYRILDSQYFGLAQRRKRVFIVGGARASGYDPAAVLFEPARREGDSASSGETRPDIAATIRGRSHGTGVNAPGRCGEDDVNLICFDWQSGGDVRHNYSSSSSSSSSLNCSQTPAVYQDITATLNSGGNSGGFRTEPGEHLIVAKPLKSGGNDRHAEDHETYIVSGERARALVGSMFKRHDDDTDTLIPVANTLKANSGRRHIEETMIASPLTASAGHHGHSSPRGDGRDNLVAMTLDTVGCGTRATESNNLVSHALTVQHGVTEDGTGRGVPLAPSGVRRLTPLECERLQGFPDGWTCSCGEGHRGSQFCTCPDSARYKALGNAVSVPVAEWIARRIVAQKKP